MTIDYWKLSDEFKAGDYVQKTVNGDLSPYMGRVTTVLRGIGCLDVQWPFGSERVHPDEVVKVNKQFARFLPPVLLDQTLKTVEVEKARKASESWRTREFSPSVYVDLARHWHRQASEVLAYDNLYRSLAPNVNDDALRDEVSKFYRFARNAGDLRIQSRAEAEGFHNREAAYWFAQNRTYRATAEEIKSGKPSCPKCAKVMRKTTYKMQKGAKVKLFACPKCLFLLDPGSILGPSGEAHEWFSTAVMKPTPGPASTQLSALFAAED